MQFKLLGTSELNVSTVCLGTMMMGSQTDNKVSKRIMSESVEAGVNFLDTAEMYSIPPVPETQGNSERYVGEWLKERGKRDDLIIATKVTGRCPMHWIRGINEGQELCLDAKNITHAIENSLRRLQTDYIDLYQIHWPDRPLPKFGFDMPEAPLDSPDFIPIEETLHALQKLVQDGKVRYIGVSNENLNGVKEYQRLADEVGLPMIASIQNAYSLVNREFEDELASYCLEQKIGLLPYSILAMGHLTGKYLDGQIPPDSRMALFNNLERYAKLDDGRIVKQYEAIARDAGMTLNELAHSFVCAQDFVDSIIIGATSSQQLAENLKACALPLADEFLARINDIHNAEPNPCP